MLPSIRLIAATFFCGFVVVFAGLRIAASLNDIHEGLPVIYDLRFVAANTGYTPTLASLAPAPPLDITPPAIERVTREELPAPAGSAVASAKDDGPVAAAEPQSPAQASAPAESPAPAVEIAPNTPSEP